MIAGPATTHIEDLDAALRATGRQLAAVSDTPQLDARWLFEHALGLRTADLIIQARRPLADEERDRIDALIARRLAGEPLAYIIGRAGFWTLDLAITPDVLVPRADTETLIEVVLDALPADQALTVADLGTGSGAIALALAVERPRWSLIATDASAPALACARDNARRLGMADRVDFYRGEWLEALAGQRVDAIVANPPYIAPDDSCLQSRALRHEPQVALIAACEGYAALAQIIETAPATLGSPGRLAVEHGAVQASVVRALFEASGFVDVQTRRDLGGHPRVTWGVHR